MQKGTLTLLLTALLLLNAILFPVPGSAELTGSAVTHLLDDLIGQLRQEEILYGDLLWVVEAFERYDQEKNWENLLLARAELSIAQQDIEALEIKESALTPEDLMVFLNAGIDVSFMENEGASLQAEQITLLNTCKNLQNSIMERIFLAEDWKNAMHSVNAHKQNTEYMLQYYANMADWILTNIGKPEISERFYAQMAEYCPLIHAHRTVPPQTAEENEAATDALLRKISDLNEEMNKIIGDREDIINRLSETLSVEDWKLLSEDLVLIPDAPPFLYFPPNINSETKIRYYWTENGEIIPAPAPGSSPTELPELCCITMENTPAQDVRDYRQLLSYAGLDPLNVTDEDNRLSYSYSYNGSSFSVEWQDQTMKITMRKNHVLLIPTWYLPALSALNEE